MITVSTIKLTSQPVRAIRQKEKDTYAKFTGFEAIFKKAYNFICRV